MEIQTEHASSLTLKGFFIVDARFKRSENFLQDTKLHIHINHKIESISADNYKVTLELYLGKKRIGFALCVKSVAYFETWIANLSLIEAYAINIMFPYIRSYVSDVTAQPGGKSVVLPIINPSKVSGLCSAEE